MRAHLVQLDIAWEDPAANFGRVRQLLGPAGVGSGDLILLPEMFDTGFSMNTSATADRGGTLAFLTDLARELGACVQGGRTVRAGEETLAANVMSVLAAEAGSIGPRLVCEYQKIHLFTIGQEKSAIAPGRQVRTYRWGGGEGLTVCPAICYDLRFPEVFRQGLKLGAEAFAIGACWLETRHAHWKPLLIARAIENQAFVLAANRTGSDPNARYLGGTIAINPRGEVLGELDAREGVLSVEIDPADVRTWREKFPAWRDGRL